MALCARRRARSSEGLCYAPAVTNCQNVRNRTESGAPGAVRRSQPAPGAHPGHDPSRFSLPLPPSVPRDHRQEAGEADSPTSREAPPGSSWPPESSSSPGRRRHEAWASSRRAAACSRRGLGRVEVEQPGCGRRRQLLLRDMRPDLDLVIDLARLGRVEIGFGEIGRRVDLLRLGPSGSPSAWALA